MPRWPVEAGRHVELRRLSGVLEEPARTDAPLEVTLVLRPDTTPAELAAHIGELVRLQVLHGDALGAADLHTEHILADPLLRSLVPQAGSHCSWVGLAAHLHTLSKHSSLARATDDLERRAAFGLLAEARGDPAREDRVLAAVTRHLGPADTWLRALKRTVSTDRAHLVLVLTWECEIRCTYCAIPKQGGRVMPLKTVEQGVDLLLSADSKSVELRFFGGEPMMQWGAIQHAITTAQERAADHDIEFLITTNGWALTAERIRWLADHPVRLQVALEGDAAAQNRFRKSLDSTQCSYAHSVATHAALLRELAIDHDLIWVVNPASVDRMVHNFTHIANLGFPRIQLNWAHGMMWSQAHRQRFAAGLHTIAAQLRERWARGQGPWLVNLGETLAKVRTFREVTVDWDGTVLANNAFLYRTHLRDELTLGHLGDGRCFDRYRMDGLSDDRLLELSFPDKITANNAKVGAILNSFVRWMRAEGLPEPTALATISS